MPMGLDDALDIKLFAEIQEQFMFIGSIDKKAFPVSLQRITKTLLSIGPTTTL